MIALSAFSAVVLGACGERHLEVFLGDDLKRTSEASSSLDLDEEPNRPKSSFAPDTGERALVDQEFDRVTIRASDGAHLFELDRRAMVNVMHDDAGVVARVNVLDSQEILDSQTARFTIDGMFAGLRALGWDSVTEGQELRVSKSQLQSCVRQRAEHPRLDFVLDHPVGAEMIFMAFCDARERDIRVTRGYVLVFVPE